MVEHVERTRAVVESQESEREMEIRMMTIHVCICVYTHINISSHSTISPVCHRPPVWNDTGREIKLKQV